MRLLDKCRQRWRDDDEHRDDELHRATRPRRRGGYQRTPLNFHEPGYVGGPHCSPKSVTPIRVLRRAPPKYPSARREAMVDLPRINGIFDAIDTDKSGTIDAQELMMHLLGCGQEHESVSALFKVLDTDGDGLISREEFIAGFEKLRVAESSEVVLKAKLRLSDEEYAELKADFNEIDTNKSGTVDISEVRTLLTKERNGTAPTEAEVEEMMSSFDKDADGQITLAEYLAALGYTPPDQEAYDGLEAIEPTDQEADQEAAAAAPPVDAAAQLAASRLKSSKVLNENASVQAS